MEIFVSELRRVQIRAKTLPPYRINDPVFLHAKLVLKTESSVKLIRF